jgi:hypothetical protein
MGSALALVPGGCPRRFCGLSDVPSVIGFLGLPLPFLGGAVNAGCSLGLSIIEDLDRIIF